MTRIFEIYCQVCHGLSWNVSERCFGTQSNPLKFPESQAKKNFKKIVFFNTKRVFKSRIHTITADFLNIYEIICTYIRNLTHQIFRHKKEFFRGFPRAFDQVWYHFRHLTPILLNLMTSKTMPKN